jgi:phage gp29-like protein
MIDPQLKDVPRGIGARVHAIASAPRNDRYQNRIGNSLNPGIVSSILRSADIGEMQRLADLLDEVREKDGHLQSVLGKREMAVAGAEWEIMPAPGTPPKKAERIVKFCTEALQNMRAFPQAIADLMSAVYHGRAVCEVIMDRDGRRWVPTCIEPVHPRRFRYSQQDWKLRIWDNDPSSIFNSGYGIAVDDLNALLPGKFILHAPRIRGGYPTREGLGRTCVWYSGLFKAFGWRDFLAFAEQYGRPIRTGTYGSGKDPKFPQASDEDVAEMLVLLEALSSSVSGVFPDTTKPEFHNPAADSHGVHPELIRLCNEEISKAVLGSTLGTEVGTSGGNRALGQVHQDGEQMIARNDARAVSATLKHDLLRPMVLESGLGDEKDIPTIEIRTDPPESQDLLATRYATLSKAGLRIGQTFVRDRFSIPEPKPDEEVMAVAPPVDPNADPAADPKAKKKKDAPGTKL